MNPAMLVIFRSTWLIALTFAVSVAHAATPEPHAASATPKQPIPLIFDTDIGNDIDDALALGVIHALMTRGECTLLAVTVTKDAPMSAPFVDVINTFYGREIPIGVVHDGPTPEPSKYTPLANKRDGGQLRYPHTLATGRLATPAVTVLRDALSKADDHSVVIVQVGSSTNLSHLLASDKDGNIPLMGMELVKKKVRLLSVMAGSFAQDSPKQAEFNVKIDVPAAKSLFANWPTPIVFSGFEVGVAVLYPAASIEHDFSYVPHHPLAEAYKLYDHMPYDRPSWDLTSVLYAVRPDGGYFDLSPPGRVRVQDDGVTVFEADPKGQHRFLILRPEERLRVQQALVQLASQPPGTVRNH
jgi:purine nucleosidase